MDPWGAVVADVYKAFLADGYDIRPTIAVTKAHIDLPEIREASPPVGSRPMANCCC
jgi:hypothetical protein